MNLKSLSKISEKITAVAISLYFIFIVVSMILTLSDSSVHFYGLSRIDDIFDVMNSIQTLFLVTAVILVVFGIIQFFKQKQLGINKYLRYPIYYFFLSRVSRYILDLLHAFSEKRVDPFMREPVETPWYFHLLSILGYSIFAILVFHFIIRKKEEFKKPVEVHKLKRLFNWLIDNLHITVFFFIFISSLPRGYVPREFESFDFSLLLLITSFIYYFFSELLFGQTIGKIPDNSFVQYKGNRLKAIFIRTICRFIPFEPFSFLFAEKGWHDRFSNTKVVIEEKSYSESADEPQENPTPDPQG